MSKLNEHVTVFVTDPLFLRQELSSLIFMISKISSGAKLYCVFSIDYHVPSEYRINSFIRDKV